MSLRETIESAVNTVEQATPVDPVVEQEVKTEVARVETEEQRQGRTAGRARDEHGRLLPGKAERTIQQQAVQAPLRQAMPPPSSWKKDHWESWGKIATENPALAEYLNQREGEFAKGVSTYKQEYEAVKPLADAMQPFIPTLQQYGVQPAQWITNLGNAHHQLVFGSPQQKLQMFAKLAQDYQVPLQALYDPQMQSQFLMQQSLQPAEQPDVRSVVQEQLTEVFAKQDLQQFQAARDQGGNPLYPHFDTVRNTMAQLLEANLAQDLKSAYDKAIRMHDDIWQQEQAAKQAAAEKSRQQVQQKQVSQARAAAVSPRTATPGADTPKRQSGIRSAVEAAVEAHAEGGRV